MDMATELAQLKADLVALRDKLAETETLFKAACRLCDQEVAKNRRLEGELAKAKGVAAAVVKDAPRLKDAIAAALQPQHDHSRASTRRVDGGATAKAAPTHVGSAIGEALRTGQAFLGDVGGRDAL